MDRRGFFKKMAGAGRPQPAEEIELPQKKGKELGGEKHEGDKGDKEQYASREVEYEEELDDFQRLLQKKVNRRNFLARLFAAGTVITGSGVLWSFAKNKMEKGQAEQENLKVEKELLGFVDELNAYVQKELLKKHGNRRFRRSIEDTDKMRAEFMQNYSERVLEKLKQAQQLDGFVARKKHVIIKDIFQALDKTDSLAVYYKSLADNPKKGAEITKNAGIEFKWRMVRQRTIASDYLPTSKEIEDMDIDPRDLQTKYAQEFSASSARNSAKRKPAWLSMGKQKAFRRLLDDEEVRQLLSDPEQKLTLAEAYSAIKAAIKRVDSDKDIEKQKLAVRDALKFRQAFMKKELVGEKTQTFISFTHQGDKELRFSTSGQEVLLATTGIEGRPQAKLKEDGTGVVGLTGSDVPEAAISARKKIQKAIECSDGQTAVYFNTHGSEQGLLFSSNQPTHPEKVRLSNEELAKSLVKRAIEKGKDSLGDMIMFIDSCYSYDYSQILAEAIKKVYESETGQSFVGVKLPTIVASTQEGSASYGEVLARPLAWNEQSIADAGRLSGEFLLRRIQPYGYPYGDLTIFDEDISGQWGEVARTASVDQQVA